MPRRRRIEFRDAAEGWTPDLRSRAAIVELDVPGADGETERAHPVPADDTTRDASWTAGWSGVTAVVLLAAAALTLLWGVAGGGEDPAPRADRGPTTTDAARPGMFETVGADRITTGAVVAAPYRGIIERHQVLADELEAERVHRLIISGPPGDAFRRGAVLVVDATRRVQVRGAGDLAEGRFLEGVRVLGAPAGVGLRSIEWDVAGYGLSLTSVGLTLDEQLTLAGAVELPSGRSLLDGGRPTIDRTALLATALTVRDQRSGPATIVGGPLVGQVGVDAVEGYVYRVDPPGAGAFLIAGSSGRVLTAADLVDTLGDAVRVPPELLPGAEAIASMDYGSGQLVGFRVTGRFRVLIDHPAGVTFELVSDTLDSDALLIAARSVDFNRLVSALQR